MTSQRPFSIIRFILLWPVLRSLTFSFLTWSPSVIAQYPAWSLNDYAIMWIQAVIFAYFPASLALSIATAITLFIWLRNDRRHEALGVTLIGMGASLASMAVWLLTVHDTHAAFFVLRSDLPANSIAFVSATVACWLLTRRSTQKRMEASQGMATADIRAFAVLGPLLGYTTLLASTGVTEGVGIPAITAQSFLVGLPIAYLVGSPLNALVAVAIRAMQRRRVPGEPYWVCLMGLLAGIVLLNGLSIFAKVPLSVVLAGVIPALVCWRISSGSDKTATIGSA